MKTPPKRDIVVHENHYDMGKLKGEEEVSEIIEKYCGVKQLNRVCLF